MLGFDAINSERSSGTLNRLIAQPIYRDSVIIGKFLAGAALISIMVISTGVLIGAVGFLKIGILPSGEELVRVAVYLLYRDNPQDEAWLARSAGAAGKALAQGLGSLDG